MVFYNIYCDESCHLEHDRSSIMSLGAVWCPKEKLREINSQIKAIKMKHKAFGEVKWINVQAYKLPLYKDLINYFFNSPDLNFRTVIVDKTKLNHRENYQTHDDFYYKAYYLMFIGILSSTEKYRAYIDIKDTVSHKKVEKLKECIFNKMNSDIDSPKDILEDIITIRSHEIQIMQLTDILLGAITYFCRSLSGNSAKNDLIELIKRRAGCSLLKTSLLGSKKLNILHFPNGIFERLSNE